MKPLELKGVVLLHVHIGDLQIPVWFGVVHKLAVDILVGNCFIDCYARVIFPSIHRITLRKSRPA